MLSNNNSAKTASECAFFSENGQRLPSNSYEVMEDEIFVKK